MKHLLVTLSNDWKYESHELLDLGDLWFQIFNLQLNKPFRIQGLDKWFVLLFPTVLCSASTGSSRVLCVQSAPDQVSVYVVHDLYFTGLTYMYQFSSFRHRYRQLSTALRESRDCTIANRQLFISPFMLTLKERTLFRAQYASWKAAKTLENA